ncbi:predicted protein [Chaetomium globosum CBS 148.51]|uniref:RING-type domain-containing protein n=1 Tax=Chaetomium globosum (strain ATCC 6205 / CBS 148.51 / DSM 1962 / NBRC 6347 / NRRL 1970) TaxID=306901 RepID=Q2H4P9_CHAGB|nr:uncharacterized protein CHGG_06366 [Chaetomium globosum CBS 148.51]EAQ89747.1 predicted protein [Chaetomium globosum CBS 148.51]
MEGNPTPPRPMTGVPGDRKIAAAIGQKTTIPGTSGAPDPTVRRPITKSIPLRIITQNLAALSIGKKRPLDDLAASVEACGLSGDEPDRRVVAKKLCGGLCGGDSIDSDELVAMWMEGRAHSCHSVRNGLRAPPPSPIFVFDDTSSDTSSEEAGSGEASDSWETVEESGAGGDGDEVRSGGGKDSDCNDGSYEPSEASTESDEGSEWDSDDWEGDLDFLRNVGWWNNHMEAPTFKFVKLGIKGEAVGQNFPPIPTFVRCSLCLDTQLSILGLPIFKPIYHDDIRHLKPGVILICGHMFCKACWTRYVEDYHDSIVDRDDDGALEQIEGSPHEEDDIKMSYDDDPCDETEDGEALEEAEEDEKEDGEAEDEEREEEEGEEEEGEEEEGVEEEEGEEEDDDHDDDHDEEGEQLPPCLSCPICHYGLVYSNGFFQSKDWNM